VTPPATQPWRAAPTGIKVLVRVTPKASREDIDGVADTAQGPALAVRVRAVADKGEANRAVETLVAEWLGVAKRSVEVAAGGKSRAKTLAVSGDPARLAAIFEARVAKLR
jgi:uncharacterized protein